MHNITVSPDNICFTAPDGSNLLSLLRDHNLAPDAPCGGNGKCGKCKVFIDGEEALACHTTINRNMTVTIPQRRELQVLQSGLSTASSVPNGNGFSIAFDIGTTTVVCYLMNGNGTELAVCSMPNPQSSFGADVVSRLRSATGCGFEQQCTLIRQAMTKLIHRVCEDAALRPEEIRIVSVVGNPAMQQIFLGIPVDNLVSIPFTPALKEVRVIPCETILPICPLAELLIVPNISGYVGADTLGCVLSTELYQSEKSVLMVDIGTNGEMVLGSKARMVACSTAAGPALEGAGIQFGMCAASGAIDHIWLEDGNIRYSIIGGGEAVGICGSGLIDAVAVALELGLINKRGRILDESRIIPITEQIFLTQDDIRQVQLAKGAIHAGIQLMMKHLGLQADDISKVQLAGAFGSYLNPASACRIGLLPSELQNRIEAVGNAAGSGAKLLCARRDMLSLTDELVKKIEFLELASLAVFPKTFAKAMEFSPAV